jgi:hypothetical protein
MNPLVLMVGALVVIFFLLKMKPATYQDPADEPRTREQLRDFILGKTKRSVYYDGGRIFTNHAENQVIGLQDRYRFGKMFELAAKSESGELPLSNGDRIAPHSRAHGLSAGKGADQLRINILQEYGIDIATMEDLEVGDEEFIARRKAELIEEIQKGWTPDDDGDSSPDLPTEG